MKSTGHFSAANCCEFGNVSGNFNALEKGRSGDVGVRKVLSILDYLGYELTLREKSPFPTLEELTGE
ncbi:hypothetical protein [Methylicorpusculum sp.]|uniref:hypothetical protein n=1 Tax=Methylicorpusculum sp. TaxID=2713644 RepID=UPI00271DD1CE|nr:hypothetical protein [Methylicorpusculum sp.]MDO8843294.1 hypothetical protein [Methylicorpusculum sp.]